jgi:hypothetical protein
LESNIATGTAPLIVASTTVVANLNASQLEGNAAAAFLASADIDSLAELNAIVADATLVDTGDIVLIAATSLAATGFFLDEDDLVSDDDTKVASQQSIKAYVDAAAGGSTVSRTMLTPIETIDNTGAAGDFDFNSIAAGYDRLIIKGNVRSDVSADFDNLYLFLNADTTAANYHNQHSGSYNGSGFAVESAEPKMAFISGATSPAASMAQISVVIEDPNSANLKGFRTEYGYYRTTDAIYVGASFTSSAITAAITRIRIQTDNDPTDELFGTLTLYGEKNEDILVP